MAASIEEPSGEAACERTRRERREVVRRVRMVGGGE
jgi:hypothetical protein